MNDIELARENKLLTDQLAGANGVIAEYCSIVPTVHAYVLQALAPLNKALSLINPPKAMADGQWGRSLNHVLYGPKLIAECRDWETAEEVRRKLAAHDDLLAALKGLVGIIDSAGLQNLTNGVELGPTVWFVKASEAMEFARDAIAKAEARS